MVDPPKPDLELHTAKTVCEIIRLYLSTGVYPHHTKPGAMRRVVGIYTSKEYSGYASMSRALADLEGWIKERERVQ